MGNVIDLQVKREEEFYQSCARQVEIDEVSGAIRGAVIASSLVGVGVFAVIIPAALYLWLYKL
jgi:hypothetical protein